MTCKWLTVARAWRETLIDAELLWADLLDCSEEDLKTGYKKLLIKYDGLIETLGKALETETHLKTFWEFIFKWLNLGKDTLLDLSEYGCLKEKGFNAAMQRMDMVREIQEAREYSPDFIEEQQDLYRKHWFEHPRLAYEVPKAILHELCATITNRADYETIANMGKNPIPLEQRSSICTCIKNHFAFSRELACQEPDLMTNLPEYNDEHSCIYGKCKNWE